MTLKDLKTLVYQDKTKNVIEGLINIPLKEIYC